MADGVKVTAVPTGFNIAADETASGYMQVIKLAYSADGSPVHAQVDADGVLVNLGTNNDVTIGAPVGVTGTVGVTGAVGVLGGVGITGIVGTTGIRGVTGTVGVTGIVGITGNVGVTGSVTVANTVGVTGAVGVTGIVGITGNVGVSGTVSLFGAVGITGNVGVTGAVGPSGIVRAIGDIVHDAIDSGAPVKVGFVAITGLTGVASPVAAGDRVNAIADVYGRQLTAHIDPAMARYRVGGYTSSQVGASLWSPATGYKIAVTSLIMGSYGATAGRVIVWFGAPADSAYTHNVDMPVCICSFAPGTGSKPGIVVTPAVPIYAASGMCLKITTDAALSLDVVVAGYEY